MSAPIPYREFYYPLNVFMHVLTHEEGDVAYLHYGLFEDSEEPIGAAQERSTALLFERLPPPPASVLDVGIGLATTLDRLVGAGYDAEGITPDEKQIALVRGRHGERLRVHATRFQDFQPGRSYTTIIFQESSQYIPSAELFGRASGLTGHVIVLDEFALRPLDASGALHRRDTFLSSAEEHGFRLVEELDLSREAAPTVSYFIQRIPRYRKQLIDDLGLDPRQIDDLIESGKAYVERYEDCTYGYRLMQFRS